MVGSIEVQETIDYVGINERPLSPSEKEALLRRLTSQDAFCSGAISQGDLGRFSWRGGVLGELILDKQAAVAKGVRYRPFKDVASHWFASATIGIPDPEAALSGYILAEQMQHLVDQGSLVELEQLISGVSHKTLMNLCGHYRLHVDNTELLLDDNATMVLYQFLGLISDGSPFKAVTFFDTGRVMPEALLGKNPENMPFNFKPNIDIWRNREFQGSVPDLPQNELFLVEHYVNDHYRDDDDILAELLELVRTHKPKLFVIPTVTRLGRRLPFLRYLEGIRSCATQSGYDPVILLDDAQGLGRLAPSHYSKSGTDLWQYADGVLGTGAKAPGALMGSGFLLLNGDRFKAIASNDPKDSPLLNRARRYSFISTDSSRVARYNASAPGLVHTPELGSFSLALEKLRTDTHAFHILRELRVRLIALLKAMPEITVLDRSRGKTSFVDSLVAFYLSPIHLRESGGALKQRLAEHVPPVTLPALVTADERHYLRIALDPHSLEDENYPTRIEELIALIRLAVSELR